MPIKLEMSGKRLHDKLAALLTTADEDLCVSLEFFDGTLMHIEAKKKWDIELGVDYISVELILDLGLAPTTPTIIPFSSIKSIHVID